MGKWLVARLREKSTWFGLITTVVAVYTGPYATLVGQGASLVLGALGGGLMTVTTKPEK